MTATDTETANAPSQHATRLVTQLMLRVISGLRDVHFVASPEAALREMQAMAEPLKAYVATLETLLPTLVSHTQETDGTGIGYCVSEVMRFDRPVTENEAHAFLESVRWFGKHPSAYGCLVELDRDNPTIARYSHARSCD
jgi:hypothetical protein